jgi:hypothetical protein
MFYAESRVLRARIVHGERVFEKIVWLLWWIVNTNRRAQSAKRKAERHGAKGIGHENWNEPSVSSESPLVKRGFRPKNYHFTHHRENHLKTPLKLHWLQIARIRQRNLLCFVGNPVQGLVCEKVMLFDAGFTS